MTTRVEEYLETISREGQGTPADAIFFQGGDPRPSNFGFYVPDLTTSTLPNTFIWVDPIGEMRTTIAQLEARVAALEEEIQVLRGSVGEEVIVLRTIGREQAKEEALELFEHGQPLLYSDVARTLRIDLATAIEICEELINEGKVEAHGNSD